MNKNNIILWVGMMLSKSKLLLQGFFIRDTWHTLGPCDVLLVRHDNDCGYAYQGKAYAHLLDSFGDLCIKKGLKVRAVATPISVLVGSRAYNSPVSYNQAHIIIGLFQRGLKTIKGTNVALKWAKSHRVAMWCDILDKAEPKIVVGIQPDEYLCRAGKKKGIPVYDLQHGVIADEHPWYGENYRISTPIEDLPDGFLCWDEQSVATIAKWAGKKDIRVIKIGNPWFLRFFQDDPNDNLVSEAIAQRKKLRGARPTILVSLQWGMLQQEVSSNGILVDALEKVIIETIDQYNWILRLHPVQLRSEERKTVLKYLTGTFGAEKAQEWLESSQDALPLVLHQADLHITYNSTVVIEAAWMGVRSALLDQKICNGDDKENYYAHERSIGMVEVLPQDPTIIKQWITNTLEKGRAKPTLQDSSQAIDAFIEEIADGANNGGEFGRPSNQRSDI